MTYRLKILRDKLTRRITCCDTFEEFINLNPNYRPTILANPGDRIRRRLGYLCLANQYDIAQEERGDPRRAFQGTSGGHLTYRVPSSFRPEKSCRKK